MGVVHRAWDTALSRLVAIKMIQGVIRDPKIARERVARFRREASAVGRLRHEGIVGIHEVDDHHGQPFIVMDFVDGESLEAALTRGALDHRRLADAVRRVALALQHAHEAGIIHRDVKPENVLIDREGGVPKLLDFGLAMDEESMERLTQSGQLMGTPLYMAPEQLGGRDADPVGPATDVYALGGLLYRGLAGNPPFIADAMVNIVAKLVKDDPEPPSRVDPTVPAELEAITLRCLAKKTKDRFGTATEVAAALGAFLGVDEASGSGERRARSSSGAIRRARSSGRRPAATAAPAPGRAVPIAAVAAGAIALVAFAAGLILPQLAPGESSAERAGVGASDEPTRPPDRSEPPRAVELPAEAPREPGPPADPSWRAIWSDGDGARPEVAVAALWASVGRVADPLAGVRDGGDALDAAFLGSAEKLDDGRIRVRYDPATHGRIVIRSPQLYFLAGGPRSGWLSKTGIDATRIEAPNDAGTFQLRFGEAHWERLRFEARLRLQPIDTGAVNLAGALKLHGREKRAGLTDSTAKTPLERVFDGGWHTVAVGPDEPAGGRVLVDGETLEVLDGPVAAIPRWTEPPSIHFSEIVLGIDDVIVSGRPRRPDVPAIAAAPAHLTADARVAAAFTVEVDDAVADPVGGPFVGIGDPTGDRLVAELTGDRLIVRHGELVLGSAALPGAGAPGAGWITLEQRGDTLNARAELAGRSARVEVAEPLPLRSVARRALWGSMAPRVRFESIAIHEQDDATGWAAWSRLARERSEQALRFDRAENPRAVWRRASLALAAVTEPSWAAERFVGSPAQRRSLAVAVTPALHEASLALTDASPVRRDLLARLALAAVLGGEPVRATFAIQSLMDLTGGAAGARAALDRLVHDEGSPSLVLSLARGLQMALTDPDAAIVATQVAEIVARDLRGEALHHRAAAMRTRLPEIAEADRVEALEMILDALEEAAAEGVDSWNVEADIADALGRLGRHDDAVPHWRIAIERRSEYWWVRFRLAETLTNAGRIQEALEELIGAIARAPGRGSLLNEVGRLVNEGRLLRQRPGLVAAALVVVADGADRAGDRSARQQLIPQVRALIEQAEAADPRDADLLAYAAHRIGEETVRVPPGDRPTAILVRTRLDPRPERGPALRRAAVADPLVGHLARTDERLAGLITD